LTTEDPVAAAGGNEGSTTTRDRSLEEQFALECMAHSFVAWQSPEWEDGQALIDLRPDNLLPFIWDHRQTPTFLYYMQNALRDLIYVDTRTANSSWSVVKSLY
jgi:hypothetical protein